jgi:hypothetical protein
MPVGKKNPPSNPNILGFDSSSDGGFKGTLGANKFDSSENEDLYNRSNTENL